MFVSLPNCMCSNVNHNWTLAVLFSVKCTAGFDVCDHQNEYGRMAPHTHTHTHTTHTLTHHTHEHTHTHTHHTQHTHTPHTHTHTPHAHTRTHKSTIDGMLFILSSFLYYLT